MPFLAALVFAGALALAPSAALVQDDESPDEIVPVKGKAQQGRVVYQDDEVVILRQKSKLKEFERAEVASVRSVVSDLARVLDALAGARQDDVDALLAVAGQAEEAGLHHEARLIRMRVLLLDPQHAAANEALGNKERSKTGWEIKLGKKWVPTSELREKPESWEDRWELRTLHFHVASDLQLWDAIEAAFDLERIVREFYDLLVPELRLHDVTELMEVQVHADAGAYPEPTGKRSGHFDPSDRKLFVLAQDEPARPTLAHEAVHQLFHMTTVRSQKGRGKVPSWLDEGLAEYMKANVVAGEGALRFDRNQTHRGHFSGHAASEKQFTLNRMLTMEAGDFLASTHNDAKYGQAYSLVHFLLHGADGSHRPVFFEFVRRCYEGKASMTEFKDVLEDDKRDLDDFEAAWHAYAKDMATT